MKKLFLFMITAWISLAVIAQPTVQVASTTIKHFLNTEKLQMLDGNLSVPIKKAPKLTDDTPICNVTFRCEWEQGQYFPMGISIFNHDSYTLNNDLMYGMQTSTTVTLPADTYECMMIFRDNTFTKYYVHILEQVEIANDTTLVFSTEPITHRIKFRPRSLEGEVWDLNAYDYLPDDNGNWQQVISKQGNCRALVSTTEVILKDYGYVAGLSTAGDQDPSGVSIWSVADIYTNELSDRYYYIQSDIATDFDDQVFVTKMIMPSGTENDSISNDPSNYILYQDEFKLTENADFTDTYYGGYQTFEFLDGEPFTGWIAETVDIHAEKNQSAVFYIDAPLSADNDEIRYDIALSATHFNHELNEATGMRYALPMAGNPIVMKNGEPEYIHINYDNYSDPLAEGQTVLPELQGLVPFNYTPYQKTDVFGNTTPINVFYMKDYQMAGLYFNWGMEYFGRMGERRKSDWKDLQMDVIYNGESVALADYGEFVQFASDISNNVLPAAALDFTVTAASSMVDEIPSKNITHVVTDFNNSDYIVPTLRAMQFRNSDNMVTDRFITADEGKLMFTAVDYSFPWNDGKNIYETKLQPVNAQVEYAPMGSEEWTPLEINRNDEWSSANFGYFYEASLAQVTKNSPNGWFDLKVTLTDEAGNLQEQTISPAFKINTMSGIGQVKNGERVAVAYYTVDGIRHNNAQQGVNIVRYSDGSTSKVIVP